MTQTGDRSLVPVRKVIQSATRMVPYLTPDEVDQIVDACNGRNRERDQLLILTLFQTGLRVSEALGITPRRIGSQNGHAVLYIRGKGAKPRMVACPDHLAHMFRREASV